MPKTKTLVDAISAAIKLEAIKADADLSVEQKQEKIGKELDTIANSNFSVLGEMGDEMIDLRDQAETILNNAGIDPAEYRRANALEGVRAAAQAAVEEPEPTDQELDDMNQEPEQQ